jgi:hypothetical protein
MRELRCKYIARLLEAPSLASCTQAREPGGIKPRVSPGREPHSLLTNIELDITQGRKGSQAANVRPLTTQ